MRSTTGVANAPASCVVGRSSGWLGNWIDVGAPTWQDPVMRVVACDESGSEGEKLIGGETDVFAHAGVVLGAEAADACLRELRGRIRSPAVEYKANHLLRSKHRAVLVWLLGPSGPIHGLARVHLTDKALFVAGALAGLLGRDAVAFHREGCRALGNRGRENLLASFNDLVRAKNRQGASAAEPFFVQVEALRGTHEIVEALAVARPRLEAFRARQLDPAMPFNPLFPALIRAVEYWSRDGETVSIVHDEQLALTETLVAQVKARTGLHEIRFVDSRADARVQVADFLAGTARKIASEELNGRGDDELTSLLSPYVDEHSLWAPSVCTGA
ncbi:DUF3800 domain-containing protein [Amycolatopsis sp. NPDC059657]|uniref:DUF3800 domain-containing protein n=1 Tax=Amycolatopsis sp. NPDC059657 TaxID=3346899 RepID=UPI00366A5FBB